MIVMVLLRLPIGAPLKLYFYVIYSLCLFGLVDLQNGFGSCQAY